MQSDLNQHNGTVDTAPQAMFSIIHSSLVCGLCFDCVSLQLQLQKTFNLRSVRLKRSCHLTVAKQSLQKIASPFHFIKDETNFQKVSGESYFQLQWLVINRYLLGLKYVLNGSFLGLLNTKQNGLFTGSQIPGYEKWQRSYQRASEHTLGESKSALRKKGSQR